MAESDEGGVPPAIQERLDKVTAQRRAAEARANDAEAKLAEALERAGKVDALEAELGQYRTKETAWGEERAILSAGIKDAEGIEYARFAWQRVPEAERPAGGIAEWLSKPDGLSAGVRFWLDKAAPAPRETETPAGGGTERPGLPASNRGTVPTSPGGQPRLSAADIKSMSAEEYAKHREDILAGRR